MLGWYICMKPTYLFSLKIGEFDYISVQHPEECNRIEITAFGCKDII